jgi:hypothetical protein
MAGDSVIRRLVALPLIALVASPAWSNHYYIDYTAGVNTNNGTSESTPWKTHPWMQSASACTGSGSAPTYSHTAGDIFTFKQGSTWPNACFDMVIAAGGTLSGSTCTATDTYTFDPTWGTAGGTTGNLGQVVGTYKFNAAGSVINGSDSINAFLWNSSGYPCIVFNGMELAGMFWNAASPGSYGNVTMLYISTGQNITLSNVYAHGWTYSNPTTNGDALTVMLGSGASPYNANSRITGGVINGLNSGGAGVNNSGSATFQIPLSDNNIVENMSNGLLSNTNGITHDNQLGPINQSFDSSAHENCWEPIGAAASNTQYFYNNVVHDCDAVMVLTQGTGGSGVNEVDYIWNNVLYIGSVNTTPLQFDSADNPNTSSSVHAWNNTIYAGSTLNCLRTISRGNGNFAVLDLQNNHCISGTGFATYGITGTTFTNVDNLLMNLSTAISEGYTNSSSYYYSPQSSGGATVNAGTNLTSLATGATATLAADTTYGGPRMTNPRAASGSWDVGAYTFSGSTPSYMPTQITPILLGQLFEIDKGGIQWHSSR